MAADPDDVHTSAQKVCSGVYRLLSTKWPPIQGIPDPCQCSFFIVKKFKVSINFTFNKTGEKLKFLFRTAYRCEKEPTGELNRDSLINCINEIALNTPDK
jgi:hypothetical protein